MTFAVLALMSGLLQINPIWNIGPYNPSQVSAGSQPDFYMMWTDGLARTWPAWEIYLFGRYTIPAVFWVAVIMGLVFVVMTTYPWIEKRLTKDDAHHNLLQRPRDVPVRTGIGAMAITFYVVLTLMCVNDLIAYKFDISINATTWMGRIGMVILPPLATTSRTGSAWACSAATARCSNTASRRASSVACRTASTSRSTSRSARWTSTATRFRWNTRVPRCRSA